MASKLPPRSSSADAAAARSKTPPLRRLTSPPLLHAGENSPPLPFDLVESILSLLPTADILSAAAVSPTWSRAVHSSPRRRPPSFLLHTHRIRHVSNSSSPSTTTFTSVLDDPNSATWLHLPPIPSPPFPLRSSTSDQLLYTLSSTQLSVSSDPLHLRWTHLPSPSTWRVDPIIAQVGSAALLVAVGGVSEFEDNPLAVEIFQGGHWNPARSMPDAFKNSASASNLSSAVAGEKLHVVERRSGLMTSFDPARDTWSEPIKLLADLDPKPFAIAIAAAGDKLIVAGVLGRPADVAGVRLWEARGEEMGLVDIAEMPEDLVQRFSRGPTRRSAAGVWEVEVRAADAGGYVYVYNPSEMAEVFHWRPRENHLHGKWGRRDTGVEGRWSRTKSVVATLAEIRMEDLREALRCGSPSPVMAKEPIVK